MQFFRVHVTLCSILHVHVTLCSTIVEKSWLKNQSISQSIIWSQFLFELGQIGPVMTTSAIMQTSYASKNVESFVISIAHLRGKVERENCSPNKQSGQYIFIHSYCVFLSLSTWGQSRGSICSRDASAFLLLLSGMESSLLVFCFK